MALESVGLREIQIKHPLEVICAVRLSNALDRLANYAPASLLLKRGDQPLA